MNVLVTGANGYIGRGLVERLCSLAALPDGAPIERITLADLAFDTPPADPRVHLVRGSIAEPAVLDAATAAAPDVVFHLAAVPSGMAETEFERGLAANLHGMLGLLERLRAQARRPTLVFTSSIAVFGAPLPAAIDDDTVLQPALSYGAQKQVGEILLADYTRRGWLHGRAVRLPGIVMRPPAPNGALSIFSSDLIRQLALGESYVCPVSSSATLWLMSLERAVDNLLHAATLAAQPDGRTAWTLPALHVSISQVVDALASLFGADVAQRITYQPDAGLEAQFGRLPPLSTRAADAAGFRHDGDLASLLQRATASLSSGSARAAAAAG